MSLSRRRVLAAAGLAAATAALGAGGVVASWWNEAPEAGLRVLSSEEEGIVDAFGEACFPSGGDPAVGGREARCGRTFDRVLSGMVPAQSRLLKLALHALDAWTLTTHGSRFHRLPTPEATQVVQSWLNHDLPEVRGVVQSLYIFCGTAWTIHPDVAARIAAMSRCGYGA